MSLIRLYLRLVSIQIRSQMQYRFSFWMDIFSTALLSGSYFVALVLVMQQFKTIAGWSLGEIAFLAGMAELNFATMDMVFGGFDPDAFSPFVWKGSFDQLLLRPIPITLQVLGSRFVLRRLGRIFEGVVIFSIALALTDIRWTVAKLIYLPLVMISQVLCFGALFMVGSTLTFWTVKPLEAVNIVTYGGTEMITYPMSIYPAWLRNFFTFVLPFIFLNYFPALFFLDKPDPLGFPAIAPFLAPLAAVVVLFAAYQFWQFGLRHYQGTGS
jgi:ABC-2 type transport system permease protein